MPSLYVKGTKKETFVIVTNVISMAKRISLIDMTNVIFHDDICHFDKDSPPVYY